MGGVLRREIAHPSPRTGPLPQVASGSAQMAALHDRSLLFSIDILHAQLCHTEQQQPCQVMQDSEGDTTFQLQWPLAQ